MDWLKGKKTYLVAWLMLAVGMINFISGDISLVDFIQSGEVNIVLEGLGLGFLRAGVAKNGS